MVAWIAAGELAVPQRERDFAVILRSYGEQFLGLLYIIEQVCVAGNAGTGPHRGRDRELITELQVHTHAYKHGLVELTAGCMTAVGVDSSLALTVGPSC